MPKQDGDFFEAREGRRISVVPVDPFFEEYMTGVADGLLDVNYDICAYGGGGSTKVKLAEPTVKEGDEEGVVIIQGKRVRIKDLFKGKGWPKPGEGLPLKYSRYGEEYRGSH